MTTLQARIFLVAFVALTIAITYNATFRQDGTHPAPIAGEAGQVSARTASRYRTIPRSAKQLPRHIESATPLPEDKNIIAIQRHLAESGYEPGPTDGVLGEQTRAAIIAFEIDNKLPVSGVASQKLLKSIILGVSRQEVSGGAMQMADETTALIKSIQQTLAKLGYDPGPIDGLIGSSTGEAIQKFEADQKMPVTGRINGRLIKHLKQASGGKLSVIASR